jgi:hypothetical protein
MKGCNQPLGYVWQQRRRRQTAPVYPAHAYLIWVGLFRHLRFAAFL